MKGNKLYEDGEAQYQWQEFMESLKYDPVTRLFFERHPTVTKQSRDTFDAIGEDLDNPIEEIRAQAFWVLVAAMPELSELLHERASRAPGYRDGTGKDQKMVNRGMDILSQLYKEIVIKSRFKVREDSKDPRYFVKRAARNWKIDEYRKAKRQKLSGSDLLQFGFDDGGTSFEEKVANDIVYEQTRNEIESLKFLDQHDLAVFEAVFVDDLPCEFVYAKLGIENDGAWRQWVRRKRRKATITRDNLIVGLFYRFGLVLCQAWGYENIQELLELVGWQERLMHAIRPGLWILRPDEDTYFGLRPLTTSFSDSGKGGEIYLAYYDKRYPKRTYENTIPESLLQIARKYSGKNLRELPGAEYLAKQLPSLHNKLHEVDDDSEFYTVHFLTSLKGDISLMQSLCQRVGIEDDYIGLMTQCFFENQVNGWP